MKKLIKLSNYYHVIDDEAKIKKSYYYSVEYNEIGFHSGNLAPDETHIAITATTNPNIYLPQIINPSDDMVGKEVEVEFELLYCDNSCDETIEICHIKSISKETDEVLFDTHYQDMDNYPDFKTI